MNNFGALPVASLLQVPRTGSIAAGLFSTGKDPGHRRIPEKSLQLLGKNAETPPKYPGPVSELDLRSVEQVCGSPRIRPCGAVDPLQIPLSCRQHAASSGFSSVQSISNLGDPHGLHPSKAAL